MTVFEPAGLLVKLLELSGEGRDMFLESIRNETAKRTEQKSNWNQALLVRKDGVVRMSGVEERLFFFLRVSK
jgi:hypothetical protein